MNENIDKAISERGKEFIEEGNLMECPKCDNSEFNLILEPTKGILLTICTECNYYYLGKLDVNNKVGGVPSWNNICIDHLDEKRKEV